MIGSIKDFVMTKVITAGVTWIISLLNPASAFIKACKAIYDVVMFFVERGAQIMALVNAILDSIISIAKGNIAGAAAYVESVLAKTVPVVISFLASVLGLGGISEKIKAIIEKIREPINAAIDWVIKKAVELVRSVAGFVGEKACAIAEWWRARTSFSTQGGEKHSLYFEGTEEDATLMLASTPAVMRHSLQR